MKKPSPVKIDLPQTFAALKHRNFRLFWSGQCISLIGTWMQTVAQSWLVLELTKSAFWLGVASAFQFLPMLFFSLYAGTLIDRLPKKTVLLFTQSISMILALILAVDVYLHTVVLWHILVVAGLLGLTNTLDMPTRQAFMVDLVGKDDLRNAIVLNSTIFNAARIIGPSIAGFMIAQLGIDLCFFLNAISFIPVIAGIFMIHLASQLPLERPETPKNAVRVEIKTGLRYVLDTPLILAPIILIAVLNIFAFNFNVLIPLYAKNVFHGGAEVFGLLTAGYGVGAVVGSIFLAARSSEKPSAKTLAFGACGVVIFELLLVPVGIYQLALLFLGVIGFSLITFSTTTNSLIQLQTPDHLRGRVTSIYTFVFAGLTPIGNFLSGAAANLWGAPLTLGLGAIISLGAIIILIIRYPGVFEVRSVSRPSS